MKVFATMLLFSWVTWLSWLLHLHEVISPAKVGVVWVCEEYWVARQVLGVAAVVPIIALLGLFF